MRFESVLIANRGEIAARIIRTCQRLGYKTVAVYSDADRYALHVELADEAMHIGPARARDSYLSIPQLLTAAQQSGAHAIHPGYGFLSERSEFAQAVQDAGLIFIGPNPQSIAAMGDKSAAKIRMIESGVPCIPGYLGEDQSDARLIHEAEKIGCPVMIKAAAGGGGRGMRLVSAPGDLPNAVRSARAEATAAFGNGRLLIEKAIIGARHVEIQVFGDRHGNVVHFGERDCSVQRRNQKIVEEAPSPAVSEELRRSMGEAAVAAARAVNYVSAGTVEFILAPDGRYFFLEMNTRLQVEHPVTELVYGVDLVEWQLRVARGEALPLTQEQVHARRRGCAIEVRLCAEDPTRNFLPQAGPVLLWSPPIGKGIRVDHGLREGQAVTPYYDSMLAKVISHGEDREQARAHLYAALKQTVLLGVGSNRDFLLRVLGHPAFCSAEVSTAFVGTHFPSDASRAGSAPEFLHEAVAAVLLHLGVAAAGNIETARHAHVAPFISLRHGSREVMCYLSSDNDVDYKIRCEAVDQSRSIELRVIAQNDAQIHFLFDGTEKHAFFALATLQLWLSLNGLTRCYKLSANGEKVRQ